MNAIKKFKNLNQFRKKYKNAGDFVTLIKLKCALGAKNKQTKKSSLKIPTFEKIILLKIIMVIVIESTQ